MAKTYFKSTCNRGIFPTSKAAEEACVLCFRCNGYCLDGFEKPWQSAVTRNARDEYAIRCFLNDRRLPSNKLTKEQAGNFVAAAEHLSSYLRSTYGIS